MKKKIQRQTTKEQGMDSRSDPNKISLINFFCHELFSCAESQLVSPL